MGTEVAVGRERLTERELHILDHVEQAQGLVLSFLVTPNELIDLRHP